MFAQGYIGITTNPQRRFKDHLRIKNSKNHKLYNSLNKYQDFIFDIILKSDIDYCLDIEYKLRPHINIGLNHAKGGLSTIKYAGTFVIKRSSNYTHNRLGTKKF